MLTTNHFLFSPSPGTQFPKWCLPINIRYLILLYLLKATESRFFFFLSTDLRIMCNINIFTFMPQKYLKQACSKLNSWSVPGTGQRWPQWAKSCPPSGFMSSFIGPPSLHCSFTCYLWLTVGYNGRTEEVNARPVKPNLFTIWSFPENTGWLRGNEKRRTKP